MEETLPKTFCVDNQDTFDPANPPVELQKMVIKRLIKDVAELVCLVCVYNIPYIQAHTGLFGCVESINLKLGWVSLDKIYNDSLEALKIKCDPDILVGWKKRVLEEAKEAAIRVANGVVTRPTKAADDDLIEVVTPEIVGVVIQELKSLHMWLCGISTFEQCPHMTKADLLIHLNDAISNCSYWCDDIDIQRDLYKEVADLLTIKSKYV